MHYQYNIHKQRSFTQYSDNETGEYKSKYYIGGNYELEDNNGEERGLNFIYSPDGLVCIVETDEQNEISATNWLFDKKASKIRLSKFYETKDFTLVNDCLKNENNAIFDGLLQINYNDHLGSIYAITDENGQIKDDNGNPQIFSYDAWGNRRDYTNWTKSYTAETTLFDRGYTGHQMLDEFGIIEMNGRIYDPVIGRFFSPDPYVQSPDNSQNFNRYSYVLNNPLKYTDPSGEAIGWDDAIVAGVGFGFGYVSYGVRTGDWGWSAVGSGALSAGMFMVGYYTAGAGTASFASYNTISTALEYSTGTTLAAIANRNLPALSVPVGNNFTFNISGGAAFGPSGLTGGMSFSATYKNKKIEIGAGFGGGINYSAWSVGGSYDGHGASYHLTSYGSEIGPDGISNEQLVGGLTIKSGEFSFRIENDFFAGKGQDRWRSNAVEIGYGDFVVGTNLYNNDPKNEVENINGDNFDEDIRSPLHGCNRVDKKGFSWGGWNNGQTYISPAYVGYKHGNSVTRIGYSHRYFQDATQNSIHKWFGPGRQHYYAKYKYFNKGIYGYSGYANPFSLW